MTPLTALLQRLLARARDSGIEVRERPPALRKTRMRGAAMAADDDAAPDADLPQEAETCIIGHHALLLGELGDSTATAQAQWHRFVSQAAISRSWLQDETSEDLKIFSLSDPRVRTQ